MAREKIKGKWSSCRMTFETGLGIDTFQWPEPRDVELEYEIRLKGEKANFTINGEPVLNRDDVFKLFGGPTGSESFYIEKGVPERQSKHGWLACAGTPGRWDRLEIPAEEMKRVYLRMQGLCPHGQSLNDCLAKECHG